MFGSTHKIRLLAAALAAAATAVVAVPVAQGLDGPPDAIDRYKANHAAVVSTPPLQGSPDAIDRYKANHAAIVSTPPLQGSPDAIDRYNANHAAVVSTPPLQGPPDAIDRYLGRTTSTPSVRSTSAFDWNDFGIGAAAMLGLVLLVAGLGLGALTVRHRGGQLETS